MKARWDSSVAFVKNLPQVFDAIGAELNAYSDAIDQASAEGNLQEVSRLKSKAYLTIGTFIGGAETQATKVTEGILSAASKIATSAKIKHQQIIALGKIADATGSIPESFLNNMPNSLAHNASSQIKIVATPDKTTTILGNFNKDMKNIITELEYPKTLDFSGKQGGFNVLNAPDQLYKSPDQFWREYNKPFLDKAIEREKTFFHWRQNPHQKS